MRNKIFLIILIIISSILRLWQLGNIPYGMANDEVSYIYSAYTVWQTGGHDIHGNFLPLSFNVDSSLSPVPVYITAPFVGILGLSPFSGRLPFALLGVGSIILVYLLAKKVLQNETTAFISGLVLSLSPWHLLLTRSTWDGVSALFFFLLGIYLFIIGIKKTNILWSLPAFLLAFYSYHATKVFFLFIIPFLLILYFKELRKKRLEIIGVMLFYFITLASFILLIRVQGITRQNELIWSDVKSMTPIIKTVSYQREKNSAPSVAKSIYSNKPIQLGITVLDQYLGAFSPQYLFINGDIGSVTGYGYFLGGVMYMIDLPLLLIGIYFILRNKNISLQAFVLGSLFIAPLPAAFASTRTYIIRTIMMLPFLSIIVGVGIYSLIASFKNKFYTNIFIGFIVIVYIFCFTRFLYQYAFAFSTYGGEFWNKSNRQVSEYIISNKVKYQTIKVFSANNKTLLQYAMFSKADPGQFKNAWERKGLKQLGGITFDDDCPPSSDNLKTMMPKNSIFIVNASCLTKENTDKTIVDSLEPLRIIWNIYEKN